MNATRNTQGETKPIRVALQELDEAKCRISTYMKKGLTGRAARAYQEARRLESECLRFTI